MSLRCCLRKARKADVEALARPLDQAVGVEQQCGVGSEPLDGILTGILDAEPERHALTLVEPLDPAVGDEEWRRMAGS